jgi:hypothetical protein
MLTAIQIPSKKIIKNYSFVTVNKSIGYGTFSLHSLKKTMPLLYTHNGKILKNINVLLLIKLLIICFFRKFNLNIIIFFTI